VELLALLLRQVTGSRALLLRLHRPDLAGDFDRVLALRSPEAGARHDPAN